MVVAHLSVWVGPVFDLGYLLVDFPTERSPVFGVAVQLHCHVLADGAAESVYFEQVVLDDGLLGMVGRVGG